MRSAAALVLLASACAGVPPCPAQGGPIWRTLQSEHFALRTDLHVERAEGTVKTLENIREAVLAAVFPEAPTRPVGRLPVIVVADGDDDWREYFPDVDAAFTQPLWQPLIMMRSSHPIEEDTLIKHELVHYLSRYYVPVQTHWLAEGLASYFETLSYDLKAGTVTFGAPSGLRLSWIHAERSLPLPAIFDDRDPRWSAEMWRFTDASWLVVHYLMNQRPQAFRAYQRHLQSSPPAEAWSLAFGGPEAAAALARDVERYAGSGKYVVATAPFQPPLVSIQTHVMTDADVHVQRALLYDAGQARSDDADLRKATENIDEALRQDPHHPEALLVRQALLHRPVTEPVARAAAAEHAGDWRAWAVLALVLEESAPEQSASARARAESLAADDPTVFYGEGEGPLPHD